MRIVKTKREEIILIDKYKQDFHDKTGKWIVIEEKNENQSIANIAEGLSLLQIIKIVLDYNEWTWENTFTNGRKGLSVMKRGLIDYISMNNGMLLREIAKETGRDHTTIMYSVKEFENKLNTDILYKKLLRENVDYIKNNIHLYKDNIVLSELKIA